MRQKVRRRLFTEKYKFAWHNARPVLIFIKRQIISKGRALGMEKAKHENAGKSPSNIIIMSRKSVSITGVSRIAGFDDTQIEAETSVGLLLIRGNELLINDFDAENGELSLTGTINGMVYGKRETKRGFFARLLK